MNTVIIAIILINSPQILTSQDRLDQIRHSTPTCLLIRGTRIEAGRYDLNGNFVASVEYGPMVAASRYVGDRDKSLDGLVSINFSWLSNIRTAEHRSGLVIEGTLVTNKSLSKNLDSNRTPVVPIETVFVPRLGSTVIAVEKFLEKKPHEIPVYNLISQRMEFQTLQLQRMNKTQLEAMLAEEVTDFNEDLVHYTYKHYGSDVNVIHILDTAATVGKLTLRGNFAPDFNIPQLRRPEPIILRKHYTWTLAPADQFYNLPQLALSEEAVYEFRSGRLIKGKLVATGNFVPEIGSKVTAFKDFDPEKDKRRIYNIPGVLVKKK